MSRIYSLYLADIVESCGRIRSYLTGMTLEEFVLDQRTVDAVVRNLEIIGEAVKNLSDEVRNICPEVEWKKVARFRDVIAHHYFKIDYERVWDIAQTKIDELEAAAKHMLAVRAETENLD